MQPFQLSKILLERHKISLPKLKQNKLKTFELKSSLIIMNLAIAATGVTFGIVDMGIQALILKTWGHNERKVYLLKSNFGNFDFVK